MTSALRGKGGPLFQQHAADNIYRAFRPESRAPSPEPRFRIPNPEASDLPCHTLPLDSSHRGRNTVFREREGRRMTRPSAARFDGSLARQFDFGDLDSPLRSVALAASGSKPLRLAARPGGLRGPDKYKVLEHRRRQAQIKARRLLDLC